MPRHMLFIIDHWQRFCAQDVYFSERIPGSRGDKKRSYSTIVYTANIMKERDDGSKSKVDRWIVCYRSCYIV